MQKIIQNIQHLKKDERGIALLFTLGILSLLLVLGIAFATNAIIERKAAANTASRKSAKLVADSGVNRVMGFVQDAFEDSSKANIFPGTQTDTAFIELAGINDNLNGRYVLFNYSAGADSDTVDTGLSVGFNIGKSTDSKIVDITEWDKAKNFAPTWTNIKINDGTDDRIVGRFSFLVIDESGKIDPNYVSTDLGTPPDRPGVSAEEICWNIGTNVAGCSANLDAYDSTSSFKIYSEKDLARLISSNYFDKANKVLFPYSVPVMEAYVDTPTKKLYHRFNLTRTDWDNLTVANITSAPTIYSKSDSPHHGTGIDWIKNWSDTYKGTFTDGATRGKQIAANLIDYCDTNHIASTDYIRASTPVVVSPYASTEPTYCGLEECPYINELKVEISSPNLTKAQIDPDSSPGNGDEYYKYSWSDFSIDVHPELVNTYSTNFGQLSYLIIDYDIQLEVNSGSATPKDLPTRNHVVYYLIPSGVIFADKYISMPSAKRIQQTVGDMTSPTFVADSYDTDPSDSEITGANLNIKIKKFNIKCYLVKATTPGTNLLFDYAHVSNVPTVGTIANDLASGATFSFEVDDPRQNHNTGDWQQVATATLGNKNSICNPNPGGAKDPEPLADYSVGGSSKISQTVSTNYIRNNPMQSPWELGAIHRGAKWETINLKAFKGQITGGASYAAGDAKILDQIKMTKGATVDFKVNINSPYTDVLEDLVANIKIGQGAQPSTPDYEYPGTAGTTLAAIKLNTIANAIKTATKPDIPNPNKTFINRGQVANVIALTDGTGGTQTTDAQKESIIGKFINLTDTLQNYFTVIVTTQTIKDVGTSPTSTAIINIVRKGHTCHRSDGSKGTKDDTILFEDCKLGQYDNKGEGTQGGGGTTYKDYCGADEILSTQKVKVVFYRDVIENKLRILSYERLEE